MTPALQQTLTLQQTVAAAPFRPKTRLGFNTRVSFNDIDGPAKGLRDGIAPLSGRRSPRVSVRVVLSTTLRQLSLFAAAFLRSGRSAHKPHHSGFRGHSDALSGSDPAGGSRGTTDLLVDGRLELAISTGENAAFDAVFGGVEGDSRTEAKRRQARSSRPSPARCCTR